MNYMLINTADGTDVIVHAGGNTYYERSDINAGAVVLMPIVDRLLARAGVKISDLDILGACVGPGSFTGLRIGLTTVKALCYAAGKPCFAVNNLRLNSYNNTVGKVVSLADAGNGVCYIAAYDGDKEALAPCCVTLADAQTYIAEHGDYAVSTDRKLVGRIDGVAGAGEKELIRAAQTFAKIELDQKDLQPLYIRKPQPERGEGDL